jgi:DNA invertase Pin-like site-specific DNA recombinase
MSNTKKAIGYVRDTSQETKQHNSSLAAQKAKISEYAERQDIEIAKWFESSGGNVNLVPGAVFQFCEDNQDVKYLMVTSADRLERWSNNFKETCEALGVELVICDLVSQKKAMEE